MQIAHPYGKSSRKYFYKIIHFQNGVWNISTPKIFWWSITSWTKSKD